ncbi:unnamed protein product, partial [Durusdinium trenchii]
MSVAPVLSPESQPLPNVWEDPRLGKGTLATLLEQQPALRQRMHDQENPHVTRWLTKDATGVASVRAMALNPTLLELVAEWYCSVQPNPKALCLSVIRREVALFRELCGKPADAVHTHMDAQGIKKLFSHGIRRFLARTSSR